jgi:hypothetical protein
MSRKKWSYGGNGKFSWTRRQRLAIKLLSKSGCSLGEVAEQIGAKLFTLRRWYAAPEFQQAILDQSREDIRAALPAAKDMLLKKALEDGDKECLKLIFRIAGLVVDGPPAPAPEVEMENEMEAMSDEELLARARALQKMLDEDTGDGEL